MSYSKFVLFISILFIFAGESLADGFDILSQTHTISGQIGQEIGYYQSDSQLLSNTFTNSNGSNVGSSTEIGSMENLVEYTCVADAFVEWLDQEQEIVADAQAEYTMVFQPDGNRIEIYHILGSCEGVGSVSLLRLNDVTAGTQIYLADTFGGDPEGIYQINPDHTYELYVYAGTTTNFYNCAQTTAYIRILWGEIYVDNDAPGDSGPGDPYVSDPLEDGSPEHPFDAIQEAIDHSVSGNTVIVLDGTYRWEGNWNLDFNGKAITVRSENGPESCIIDCYAGEVFGYYRGFYFHNYEDANSIVDGFTITNGYNDDQGQGGGAIFCWNSGPTITHCIIANNLAYRGGGIYCYAFGIKGPAISNCTINNNQTLYDNGGGICLEGDNASISVDNCIIKGNVAAYGGGGVYCGGYLNNLNIELKNCVVLNNTSSYGDGGGIYCGGGGNYIELKNNTVVGNRASYSGGGIFCGIPTTPSISNVILWANDSTTDPQIYSSSTPRYSCIQDWTGGGIGNISSYPLLEEDSYHLQGNSPCINTGDPCDFSGQTDIDGGLRVVGGRVDMGADEYSSLYIYVPDDYPDILSAVQGAYEGNVIILRPGIYMGPNNTNIDFEGKSLTIQCLDPDNPDVVAATVIDCANEVRAFNFHSGEDSSSVVNGLTIINGYHTEGAAVRCVDSSPSIMNCVINFCQAEYNGGAISCGTSTNECTPVISNCKFGFNVANMGGAISCTGIANPEIVTCEFLSNSAHVSGGAIGSQSTASPSMTLCSFSNNSAVMSGGAVFCTNAFLERCIFAGNTAYAGGGVFCLDAELSNFICNHCVIDDIAGTISGLSSINLGSTGSMAILSNFTIGGNSIITGTGQVRIALGGELLVEAQAQMNLEEENVKGSILSDGFLQVKENAGIKNSIIEIVRAKFEGNSTIMNNEITTKPGLPYGQIYLSGNTVFEQNNIYATGDRYIDYDPLEFAGSIMNNYVYVTITEGQNGTPAGMFECRGRDLSEPPCGPDEYLCQIDVIPPFDPNTFALEKLEMAEGARLTITNRIDSGLSEGAEVIYVRNLVLKPYCILNTAFNRIYYQNLIDESGGTAVINNRPFLGYSLEKLTCDDNVEFIQRIRNNNFTNPQNPGFNRIHIERVYGTDYPDISGVIRIRNLLDLDPESGTYGQVVNARFKALFAQSRDEHILVQFKYMFEFREPGTEMAVYLTDIPELLNHDDPLWASHYHEIARIPIPPEDRPGSPESGRMGTFYKRVSRGDLDFIEGLWVEIELFSPPPSQNAPWVNTDAQFMSIAYESSTVPSAFVDDINPQVSCEGICLDVTSDNFVNETDYLTVASYSGCPAEVLPDGTGSLVCLDGAFSTDGFVDSFDVSSWDWTLNDNQRKNLCDGVPLEAGEGVAASATSAEAFMGMMTESSDGAAGSLNALLITGKRNAGDGATKLKDRLYVFDDQYNYSGWMSLDSERCNLRLVQGPDGTIYQVNAENGVVQLGDPNNVIIPPGKLELEEMTEPRYNKSATVFVGLQSAGSEVEGRPVLDVAFSSNYAYVLPVIVDPNDNDPNTYPYAAAAKLELSSAWDPPYKIIRLYDETPAPGDREYRNSLREIEFDDAGNVYVLNANNINENDILWKYNSETGTIVQRIELGEPNTVNYIPDPIGMYVSNEQNTLYLASAQYDLTDVNSTVINGFSPTDGTLNLTKTVRINNMHHVTGITEDPITGSLWVTGFNMWDIPSAPNPTESAFYHPYLAKVPVGSSSVTALSIEDPNESGKDLAMPTSIIWTGIVAEKCGGADLDGNGTVAWPDFAVLAYYWLDETCAASNHCDGADLEPEDVPDGDVDVADLAVLARYWLDNNCISP